MIGGGTPQLSIRVFQTIAEPRLQHYLRFNNKYSDKLFIRFKVLGTRAELRTN
jgi:hypothetical protein